LQPYGCDYFYAIHSIMLDTPYLGQKTHDVLQVLAWMRAQGHEEIHLVAKGWGTFAATFAAVLSDDVKQITLKNPLTSYSDIAESETYAWPLSCLLPNVLKFFDLPDCYELLKKKNIRQIEPWGADARPLQENPEK
jgi:pimeloyl-ACP methyl ester carboxylesterase